MLHSKDRKFLNKCAYLESGGGSVGSGGELIRLARTTFTPMSFLEINEGGFVGLVFFP